MPYPPLNTHPNPQEIFFFLKVKPDHFLQQATLGCLTCTWSMVCVCIFLTLNGGPVSDMNVHSVLHYIPFNCHAWGTTALITDKVSLGYTLLKCQKRCWTGKYLQLFS